MKKVTSRKVTSKEREKGYKKLLVWKKQILNPFPSPSLEGEG